MSRAEQAPLVISPDDPAPILPTRTAINAIIVDLTTSIIQPECQIVSAMKSPVVKDMTLSKHVTSIALYNQAHPIDLTETDLKRSMAFSPNATWTEIGVDLFKPRAA